MGLKDFLREMLSVIRESISWHHMWLLPAFGFYSYVQLFLIFYVHELSILIVPTILVMLKLYLDHKQAKILAKSTEFIKVNIAKKVEEYAKLIAIKKKKSTRG